MSQGFLDRMLEWSARGQEIQNLLDRVYGAKIAEIKDVVKSDDRATVIRGRLRAAPVFFKHLRVKDASRGVERACRELAYLHEALGDGTNQVMRVLDAFPEHGLLVTEKVPGKTVGERMKSAPSRRRQKLVRLSAEWLQEVAALRAETRAFPAQKSLTRLAPPDARAKPEIIEALNRFRSELDVMARDMEGREVMFSVGHGDFSLTNLMYDGTHMWGIDIHGSHQMPVLQMAARFCLGQEIWCTPEELAAFRPSRFAIGDDYATVFRFFIGLEMYRKYASPKYLERDDLILPQVDLFLAGWEPYA